MPGSRSVLCFNFAGITREGFGSPFFILLVLNLKGIRGEPFYELIPGFIIGQFQEGGFLLIADDIGHVSGEPNAVVRG
jgi:hypothetical protein